MADRKAFNFYKSYYDVFKELGDKDKLSFVEALLDRQFTGKEPEQLKGMAKFAYISQKSSVDSQIKGWEDKTGCKLESLDPTQGGLFTPTPQEKGEEEEKGKGEGKRKPKSVFTPPTPDEVIEYGVEKGYALNGKKICDYYTSEDPNKWVKGNGDTVKSWKKTVLSVWCKDENKIMPKEKLYTYRLQERGTMKNRTEKQYLNDKKQYDANGWKIELLSTK